MPRRSGNPQTTSHCSDNPETLRQHCCQTIANDGLPEDVSLCIVLGLPGLDCRPPPVKCGDWLFVLSSVVDLRVRLYSNLRNQM